MPASEFADLVGALAEAMGQRPDAVRGTPEGLLLHTTDGFLFAFLEDPATVSLASISRILEQPTARTGRLVVLTPGRLPLALAEELRSRGASLVEHDRFRELLRGLDLGARLGEEPRPPHDVPGRRLLPSARHLDAILARARTWYEWNVPALALRFYRQALSLKPEFVPARVGVGRCLAALGLPEEAMATFREVLAQHPEDPEARLGEAQVYALQGRSADETRIYRAILAERPERLDVRAQLIAAEVDGRRWPEARREIETLLKATPEDPRIRFLHSAALGATGQEAEGRREAERARALGLTFEQESALCAHVGLPPPAAPRAAASPTPPASPPKAPRARSKRPSTGPSKRKGK